MPKLRVGSSVREAGGPEIRGRGVHRRDFLKALGAAGAGSTLSLVLAPGRAAAGTWNVRFPEGVIAGDPQPDGAVIWTRLLEEGGKGRAIPVLFLVSEDEAFTRVVRGGIRLATSADDFTLKERVRGLAPDRWYHYQFWAPGARSRVGRLRTAPRPGATPDRLRYAFASCQQRNASFYVAHKRIAEEGVDFLMHLGDYIYVSDTGTITLDDYRNRWRLFKQNPLLQDLQAAVPLVAMLDDGEFYNGVDNTGPPARLAAARRAWLENMPVEAGRDGEFYRDFAWGRLADVFMIDVRSYRDPEVPANEFDILPGVLDAQSSCNPPGDQMFAPGRTTLGAAQRRWLELGLRRSRADWRFIGNPYNMNPWKIQDDLDPADCAIDPATQPNPGLYVSNEAWDDYQAERRELLDLLRARGIRNNVFTSGHTHIFLASELMPDFDDPASPTVAFDFVTGSLTADPHLPSQVDINLLRFGEQIILQQNTPYLKWVDVVEQGYALVDVTPEECIVQFRGIDTFDANAQPFTFASFRVRSGGSEMEVL